MDYIKLIDKEISKVKEDSKIDFIKLLNGFSMDLKLNKITDYDKVDIDKLVKNIILAFLIEDISVDEIDSFILKMNEYDFNYLYDIVKDSGLVSPLDAIEPTYENNEVSGFINWGKLAFERFNIKYLYNDKNSELKNTTILDEHINKIIDKIKRKVFKDKNLKKLLDTDVVTEIKAMQMISACLIEKFYFDDFENQIKNVKERCPGISSKEVKDLAKCFSTGAISNSINLINTTISFVRQFSINAKKDSNAKITKLEKQKKYIDGLNDDIKNLDKIDFQLLSIIDNNIYMYIFNNLFVSQKCRYDVLSEENTALKELLESKTLEILFSKFNIDYSLFDIETKKLLVSSPNELENLNDNLNELSINASDNLSYELINILLKIPNKKLKEYSYYLKSKVLSKNLLLNNLQLFESDEFKDSCFIIQSNNLSFSKPNYNESILLKENKELSDNNKLLAYYNRTSLHNNFSYLYNSYYFDILDFLLENNIDITSLDDISLSEQTADNFIKRVLICENLGIPLYNKNGNLNRNFLLGNGFYCKAEDLDNYILKSNYENEEINNFIKGRMRNTISYDINAIDEFQKLEEYKSPDGLLYDIDGIMISRPKVMRNLTLFYNEDKINNDTILASIIYNMNLNDEEIELIKKSIFSSVKKMTS